MKKSLGKKSALLLALVLMLPFWWNQNVALVSAATPAFTKSKIEIVGGGETYQLEIKNKVTGSTYKWSSTNTKVAKISSKGLVTTVGKGSATIKCMIAYSKGKSKTISCKVYVTIPATDIKINNAVEVNGAHILLLGETFDFNVATVPVSSSDKIYWSISGGDEECIRIDNPDSGIVTGLKAGKVILTATAAKTVNPQELQKSIINDAIIIEVKAPSASVGSAEIINSTELRIVFDSQIDKTTVIDANNKLINIEVIPRPNIKKVMAKDPGVLTASLSADQKTLILTATNSFGGDYYINLSSNIKTVTGVVIGSYSKQVTFIDTLGPAIADVYLDDTGMIETIQFTEAVDFTNIKISNAAVVPVTAGSSQSTLVVLNNKLNYIASEDKKSLKINLSSIAATDYGKTFQISITGIKDMTGNIPASVILTTFLRTDNTPRAQAVPMMVLRTSYNTVTATFNRGIKDAGVARINGSYISGVVDATNNKKVNYTISETDAQLSGIRVVSIASWNSYNVITTDTSASQLRDFNVDFTTDKTSPVLLNYVYDAETSTLTLSYNKEVTLSLTSGIFSSQLLTITNDIQPGCNINYTRLTSTDNKVIKLSMSNMTLLGDYTFTLNPGFVLDNFKNTNVSRTLTISNASGTSSELPAPYAVRQDQSNLSQIYLDFANKLDQVSAETLTNYTIPGAVVISAKLYKNTSDNGASVLLTVLDGSFKVTADRPVKVSGIKGYNGSFTEMTEYTVMVELKDNEKPTYISSATVFDKTTNAIRLTFTEPIQGTLTAKVTQIGAVSTEYTYTISISGNSVNLNLTNVPANGSYLRIDILTNSIKDLNGNTSVIPTTIGATVPY